MNVLRLSLHPDGMAPRIVNLAQWRAHLLGQLRRRAEQTGDARLGELHDELRGYPGGDASRPCRRRRRAAAALRHGDGELSFFTIAATVETAADVTVEELVDRVVLPGRRRTAQRLRALV